MLGAFSFILSDVTPLGLRPSWIKKRAYSISGHLWPKCAAIFLKISVEFTNVE